MKTLALFFILFAISLCDHPLLFAAQAQSLNHQETLIVIGYSDDNHIENWSQFFSHRFFFNRAQYTEDRIVEALLLQDFSEDLLHPGRFENPKQTETFTILNANVLCPGENPLRSNRSKVCAQQLQRTENLKTYLEQNISSFDQLIYIGHSRLGMGLGLGPFQGEDKTFNPVFYNVVESGRLKKVVMASCDSDAYYKKRITTNTGIEFIGTRGPMIWPEDLLPIVLNQLQPTKETK